MQKREMFKTAHIGKEILVELAILINKCYGWNGWSRLAHALIPLSGKNNTSFPLFYPI
jgi:hypothetical protein